MLGRNGGWLWGIAVLLSWVGCSSSDNDPPNPTGSDAGASDATPTGDASEGPALDAGSEPGAKSINGCTIGFQDQSGASAPRILNWDLPVANSPARCMKIKAGQSVKWQGSFQFHPLSPKDGDTPNPIAKFTSSTEVEHVVAFPNAGTFGFVCDNHSNMTGAIYVVP